MRLKKVSVNDIITAEYQMRFKTINKEIDSLARSIHINGLLCPPSVTIKKNKFVLVFGHRRLEAVKKLNWKELTVIILDGVKDKDLVVKALVENIEKLSLTPLEKAKAYQNMIEELDITHQELADRCGRDRSEISHHIRLLSCLNQNILNWLQQWKISFGHARILMILSDKNKQLEICREVIAKDLSIRDTSLLVDRARPRGELSDEEKELNKIESDIMKSFKNEWRKRINIRQGRKEEKLVVSFKDRNELKDLIRRLSRIL
ncbi:MAG: ParB/RepB/Spo0J family partition protein [Elusimicrobia bacterium]|nr:ParB/RepB/Spo0J family partition protein [Elusimicrobiota bacterium]